MLFKRKAPNSQENGAFVFCIVKHHSLLNDIHDYHCYYIVKHKFCFLFCKYRNFSILPYVKTDKSYPN